MSDPETPLLVARGVTKRYTLGAESLDVLRGVDLEVKKGEMLAIVGQSGTGKSTLLHLLGLLDRPTEGEIRLFDRVVSNASIHERARLRLAHIGFVFQFYHLVAELDALENVLLARMVDRSPFEWLRHRGEERAKARALLEQFGLGARQHHRPAQLSGGERQRVAIARALVSDPEIVLCDEPTGNLDERTAGGIVDLLFELRERTKKTFVLVTHDLSLARRADRILTLHAGQIVGNGAPEPVAR
jgi:lipoprotein-releasing system ATP-binding protein